MALFFVTAAGINEPHPRPTLSLGDMVGAVALDKDGNLAAATYTGAFGLKWTAE